MMEILNTKEIDFLNANDIAPSSVFDARGMPSSVWKRKAKALGAIVILGTPCKAAGHRLRTRRGHCVQCDTSKIAYMKRHREPGYVYIAGSKTLQTFKIGSAKDVEHRHEQLKFQQYGGVKDWQILFYCEVSEMGKYESAALTKLGRWRYEASYLKDGIKPQISKEIVKVDFVRVLKVLTDEIGNDQLSKPWMSEKHSQYNFDEHQ